MVRLIVQTRLVTPEIIEAIHGVLTHSVTPETIVVTVVVQIRLGTSVADKQLDFNPALV